MQQDLRVWIPIDGRVNNMDWPTCPLCKKELTPSMNNFPVWYCGCSRRMLAGGGEEAGDWLAALGRLRKEGLLSYKVELELRPAKAKPL